MLSKKFASVIVAILLITFIATGCGKNTNDSQDNSKPVTSFDTENTSKSVPTEVTGSNSDVTDDNPRNDNPRNENDKLITIGFAQVGHESDWRVAATESAQEVFSEGDRYDLLFVDAFNDMETQLQAVKDFISQKVDYIVVDPIVTTGWDGVMKEAKGAGIPVFVIDRTMNCDQSLYEAWFGSDFTAEGEAAGAWLEAYLKDKGRISDTVNIVTIAGTAGSTAQIGRTNGFDKYVNKNKNWTKLAEEDGKFTQTDGQKVMETFLEDFDDIDVVVCQNDNEAKGAMEALATAGITFGVNGDVIIISFDATHDGLEAVLEGKINANFECNPLSAPYVGDAIKKLEAGETIKNKVNYIHESCFQAENNVSTINYAEKSSDMITVDEKLLDARAY